MFRDCMTVPEVPTLALTFTIRWLHLCSALSPQRFSERSPHSPRDGSARHLHHDLPRLFSHFTACSFLLPAVSFSLSLAGHTKHLGCFITTARMTNSQPRTSPNHALQRTAPRVTVAAILARTRLVRAGRCPTSVAPFFAPPSQLPRHAPPSLSLGSLGVATRSLCSTQSKA